MLKSKKGFLLDLNNRVNTGRKIHSKTSLPISFFFLGGGGGIIRQTTVVIGWLIVCNPTKLWGVICLQACIS
jgi:hypothetical protein